MKQTTTSAKQRLGRPAPTVEARDAQLASKALRLAEQKIDDGTAPASLIIEILRRQSREAELERRQREADIALKEAKIEAIKSSTEIKELFEDAMAMFKRYHGDDEDAADLH